MKNGSVLGGVRGVDFGRLSNAPGTIAQIVKRDGFVFLSEYSPALSTVDAASQLGDTLNIPSIPDVQRLVPKSVGQATPNSYSGNYGLGDFPLHTDLSHWARPPRYLLLRCIIGSPGVATKIVDGKSVFKAIGAERLHRTLVRARRPLNGQRGLLRLLEQPSERTDLLRWDYLYICPASDLSRIVYSAVADFLRTVTPIDVFLVQAGDTLVIDNWRMLHGRSSVDKSSQERFIERIYLGDLH